MNQIFNRKIQSILDEVKEVLRSSMMESGITQEALADETETTQPTIHRWFAYDTSHFPPLYILALLPESITVPLCNLFLKRFLKRVMDVPENIISDGKMEDEILNIEVFVADIIKVKDTNPEKAVKICDRVMTEVFRLQKEAQEIVDAKKSVK